ncbi:hypothetical protein TBLA_0F02340 [Henningerozyma blattae CBS 6284]|uniref:DUF4536 domain-containing protein n=1 Tax=Henningerozyma blattae (strain ATCC 34711 / CBS 6284 / DSM 70876 / NBRC 10599 / NRRL Y-10934 / UCD 77-7) TaxID=1071380 RepID=I2H5X3_HENB6|nr:hypothetical protein TBLA_0F02340 [Tetrapisispora blattae CBS 6284]CCH61775.1 hypothetical protein TBLA_0F02340 [Tetrapisispora blattae CBS 6284]
MSNILNVFNPPPERDLEKTATMDCVPCQIMATMFSIGFGSYLASGRATKYGKKEQAKGVTLQEFEKRNPKWWRSSLRGFGAGLIMFGLIRGSEGWLWNPRKEYKKLDYTNE